MDVVRLYPQYNIMQERRQQNAPVSPVAFERRSGTERRSGDRIKLDTNLTRDIFEIKSKVSQIENIGQNSGQQSAQKLTKNVAPQKAERITFSHNISKAAQNSIKTDQFIKTTKSNSPNLADSPKEIAKSKSNAGALAGVLAVILGGTLASTFLGVAGVGIAIGIGTYFGGKFLKSAIVSHLKNK